MSWALVLQILVLAVGLAIVLAFVLLVLDASRKDRNR